MTTKRTASTKCRYIDDAGKRCRKNAALAGFCVDHLPKYQNPILDTSRQPRDRLQDIATVTTTLLGISKLIEVCVQHNMLSHLKNIFCELIPLATQTLTQVGSLPGLTQNSSTSLQLQAGLIEWYEDIDSQELQYRVYMAFKDDHDIFYNRFMDELRKDKRLEKSLKP